MDPRYEKLADLLIGYSCALEPGETIVIDSIDAPPQITRALVRAAARAGGVPVVMLHQQALWRDLMLVGSEEQMRRIGHWEGQPDGRGPGLRGRARHPQRRRARRHPRPTRWSSTGAMSWVPVHRDIRVPETRWCVLRWPNGAMAQAAGMSSEAFEDFYFDVCTLDYAHMSRAAEPLVELMERTDRVRLRAPGTDLSFSIRGIPAVPCDGHFNIPPTARSSPPR